MLKELMELKLGNLSAQVFTYKFNELEINLVKGQCLPGRKFFVLYICDLVKTRFPNFSLILLNGLKNKKFFFMIAKMMSTNMFISIGLFMHKRKYIFGIFVLI